jgi:hypothetical protein
MAGGRTALDASAFIEGCGAAPIEGVLWKRRHHDVEPAVRGGSNVGCPACDSGTRSMEPERRTETAAASVRQYPAAVCDAQRGSCDAVWAVALAAVKTCSLQVCCAEQRSITVAPRSAKGISGSEFSPTICAASSKEQTALQ